MKKLLLLCFSLIFVLTEVNLVCAQTVTVNCSGALGSFQSGSVTSGGTITDGDMAISNASGTTPRGWAVFNLAALAIPAGSSVTSASLRITKSAVTGTGTPTCTTYAINSDVSTLGISAQGSLLYTTLAGGTSVNTTAWGNTAGNTTLTINAAGLTFLQNNLSGVFSMGLVVSAGSRVFAITGYGGTAATQPQLSITYVPPCNTQPVAGTASTSVTNTCPGTSFNLIATGASTGGGIIFQWQSSPAGANTWTNIAGATNATYALNTGVIVNTDFRAYISCTNNNLGDTTNITSVTVAAASLPQDFSGTTFPPCGWALGSNPTYVLRDAVTSAYGIGAGSAYINFYGLTSGNNADLVTLTFTPVAANSILSFDEAYATYSGEVDNLLVQTSANGGTSYTTLTTLTGGASGTLNTGGTYGTGQFTPSSTQWQNKQILLPAGVNKIRFRGQSAFGNNLYIDNVNILAPPSCLFPSALTATNITATSANLSWSNGGGTATQFRVEYGPQGFTPGTGSFVLATGTTYSLGGLNPGTNYSYYVRALCSATDSSSQTGPYIFHTPCLATNIPYTENFDGVIAPAVPGCLLVQDVNTDGNTWHTNNYEYTSAPNAMTYTYNFDGTTTGNDWFFTQGLNMTAGVTYQVTFKYAVSSASFPEKLEVKAGNSPLAASMTSSALFSQTNITTTIFTTTSFFYTPSTTGVYYFGWHCFSNADEDELYVDDISVDLGPTCPPPSILTATNITNNTADLGWTNGSTATQFRVEYGPQGFTPGTGTFVLATSNPYTISGLTAGTSYSFYVRALCSATDSSTQAGAFNFSTLIQNDLPVGAIGLTVNGGCIGNAYTNTSSTQSTGEPFASCRGTAGFHSVWYKFDAPPSGFVRVTNDYSGATIGNTRIAVFSTPDPSTFGSFAIIACDDNNASTVANKSLLFVNGLTPGATYYVEVDGLNNAAAQGPFCLTVDEVNSSMIATTAACAAGHAHASLSNSYRSWLSIVDGSGKLIANVRQTNAASNSPTGYTSSLNINTSGVRQYNNLYYLDRNFMISTSGTTTTPSYDVQFFFLASELVPLSAATAGGVLVGDLNVSRQANNTCQANFSPANGAVTLLTQVSNISNGGVTGIQVVTPGFSNFYINPGLIPLNIRLLNFSGVNEGRRNRLDWATASEESGDKFTLQRSADGDNFSDAYTVKANGNASSYSYWDEKPFAGINHYRIKMTDTKGAITFSNTIQLTVSAKGDGFTLEAYPNPVKDAITVKLYGVQSNNAQLQLSDITGRINQVVKMNENETYLDVHNLPAGIYLLKYTDDVQSTTIKLMKE